MAIRGRNLNLPGEELDQRSIELKLRIVLRDRKIDAPQHKLKEIEGELKITWLRHSRDRRILGRINHRHTRTKPSACDLNGITFLAQHELVGREITNQTLKNLAFESEAPARMNRCRAVRENGHVKVGGDQPKSVVGTSQRECWKE